jgi:hypothetical protein
LSRTCTPIKSNAECVTSVRLGETLALIMLFVGFTFFFSEKSAYCYEKKGNTEILKHATCNLNPQC